MSESPHSEAEKIAREITLYHCDQDDEADLVAAITSALISAEQRGAQREREDWLDHISTLGPMLADAKAEGVLDTLIAANIWPLPVTCISDEDIQAATEEARRIQNVEGAE